MVLGSTNIQLRESQEPKSRLSKSKDSLIDTSTTKKITDKKQKCQENYQKCKNKKQCKQK
jgi:hypothetical protein